MNSIAQKKCGNCKEIKPLSEFHKNKRSRDGSNRVCKQCAIDIVGRWNKAHKEYRKEYLKNYWNEHREELNSKKRVYIANHKEQRRSIIRRYTEKHREEINRRHRERSDPKKKSAYYRIYSRTDRARRLHLIRENKRRALKAGNGGEFTEQQWLELCDKYENKCLACGKKKKMTVDHVIPISRGGRNDIENIQPLCLRCNMSKHDKIIDYRNKE